MARKSSGKKSKKITYTNKNSQKDKIYVGFSTRVLFMILLVIVTLVSSFIFLRKSIVVNDDKKINYSLKGSSDYKVYLKENDFYETEYLESDMNYVASLVDKIRIEYKYDFVSDKNLNASFDYSIKAKLNIYSESGNKLFYTKEYILHEKSEEKVSNVVNHSIVKEVLVDYNKYNHIADNFRQTYNVPTRSELIVYMEIEGNVEEYNYKIEDKKLTATIPLSQKSIDVSIVKNNVNSQEQIIEKSNLLFQKKSDLVISIILFIITLILLYKIIYFIKLCFPKKSNYDKYIERILVEYDRLIASSKYMPDFNKLTVIKIDSFSELLDVRDTLKQPIIYYEIAKHKKSYFYILENEKIYLVTIKAVDLENK